MVARSSEKTYKEPDGRFAQLTVLTQQRSVHRHRKIGSEGVDVGVLPDVMNCPANVRRSNRLACSSQAIGNGRAKRWCRGSSQT